MVVVFLTVYGVCCELVPWAETLVEVSSLFLAQTHSTTARLSQPGSSLILDFCLFVCFIVCLFDCCVPHSWHLHHPQLQDSHIWGKVQCLFLFMGSTQSPTARLSHPRSSSKHICLFVFPIPISNNLLQISLL